MGLAALPRIAARLTQAGRDRTTPVAVIASGTTERQETVTGTLADLAERVARRALEPPALIVVGEVVALHSRLAWFPELGTGA